MNGFLKTIMFIWEERVKLKMINELVKMMYNLGRWILECWVSVMVDVNMKQAVKLRIPAKMGNIVFFNSSGCFAGTLFILMVICLARAAERDMSSFFM